MLPPPKDDVKMNAYDEEDLEEVSMRPINDMKGELKERSLRAKQYRSSAAYDSDDSDGPGRGQRVQCAQQ